LADDVTNAASVTTPNAVGTLKTALTGASTTEVVITSVIGSTAFDTATDLVLDGIGGTTIVAADVTGVSPVTVPHATGTLATALTGTSTTEVVITSAIGGTAFDTITILEVGSTTISAGGVTGVSSVTTVDATGTLLAPLVLSSSSVVFTAAVGVVFDATTALVVGSGTISATDINSVSVVATNDGGFDMNDDDGPHTASDSSTLVFTFSETTRAKAIEISGTPGGDGIPAVLDSLAESIVDLSGNLNIDQLGLVITEVADTILPQLLSATLDFETGVLIVQSSEILDSTPASTQTKTYFIELREASNSVIEYPATGYNVINLNGSIVTESDKEQLTITLSEVQRTIAIAMSGTQGGDGSALVLAALTGATKDIAQNPSIQNLAVSLTEIPDTLNPLILGVSLDLSTGILTLNASETLDCTPTSLLSLIAIEMVNSTVSYDTTALSFAGIGIGITEDQGVAVTQANGYMTWTMTINAATITESQGVAVTQPGATGTLTTALLGADTVTVTITSAIGQVFDADDDLVIDDGGTPTTVLADDVTNAASVTTPNAAGTLVKSVNNRYTLNINSATITASQGVAVTQNSGAVVGTLNTELTGAGMVEVVIDCLSGVVFDAATDVVISSSPSLTTISAGDINTAVHSGVTTTVSILSLPGVIYDTTTNLVVGSTTVNAVHLDSTLISDVGDVNDAISFSLNETALSGAVAASVTEADLIQIKITLTELQRNDAQRSSQYPGGDTIGMKIRVRPNAFQDIATNKNLNEKLFDIVELRDVIGPQILYGVVDLATGIMQLYMSETVLMQTLDLTKLFLSNYIRVVYPATGVNIKSSANHPDVGVTEEAGYNYNEVAYKEPYFQNEWTTTAEVVCAFCESSDTTHSDASLRYTHNTKMGMSLAGFNAIRSGGDNSLSYNPSGGPFGHLRKLLSGYALRREPGTMTLTLTGIDSNLYTFKTYHYARGYPPADVSAGMDIKVYDCYEGQERVRTTTNWQWTGSTATNLYTEHSLDVTVNATCAKELGWSLKVTMQRYGSVNWNHRMPFNGFHLREKTYPQPPSGDKQLPLVGASFDPTVDVSVIALEMTEAQRVQAVTMSGGGGGDGNPLTMDAEAGLVQDLALLTSVDVLNVTLQELFDFQRPSLTAASLNLGTGELVLTGTETLDGIPATNVNPLNMFLSNDTDSTCDQKFVTAARTVQIITSVQDDDWGTIYTNTAEWYTPFTVKLYSPSQNDGHYDYQTRYTLDGTTVPSCGIDTTGKSWYLRQ